jgi:hypothetical protein
VFDSTADQWLSLGEVCNHVLTAVDGARTLHLKTRAQGRGYGFDIIRGVLEHLESDPGEDDFAENH